MSIKSDVNKQMLIEICSGINNKYTKDSQFINFLNNVCENYHENRFNYSNIQEINKNILEELVYYMNQREENKNKQQPIIRQRPQEMNRNIKTIEASELKVQRDEGFSMKLKSREEAFKSLIEKPAPPAVEFADKNQDIPSQNLDVLMNQSLADREKELQMIMNNQPDNRAKDWLKPIETSDKNKENKKEDRKVRFEEPDNTKGNEMVNFLSKLKRTNENNNNNNISNDENIKLIILFPKTG